MGRGELSRRVGLAGAFALLLVACVAAPVLAQPVLGVPEEDPIAHEEALESPQAVAEREDSEYAYADLTPAQEENLLREHFAAQLQAIDADPARALADLTINRLDSPTEALVTVEGEKLLLESEVPLRAPEEDGDLHKVELELEETAAGYEPANPLVDLTLPDSADEPIRIGQEGLAITPLGTADAEASPLGGEDLFLPAAHEDTGLLLSPIAGGLELSALLASRNSPQQLAFEVALPAGAALTGEESGGAAVVRDGSVLATVSAPHAVDAQGAEVPVELSVEGSTLTLSLAHREMDVAYPLFVDPEIIEEFSSSSGKFSYWKWQWSGVGPEDFIGSTSCIWTCWPGGGLYVRARSNFAYPAGSWARWWFTPQGSTTYMRRVILGPINYDTHGCWANEPHAYTGLWNDYNGWEVLGNAYPTGWMSGVDVSGLKPGARTLFVGFHASANSNLSCGRDYRLGGATLFLDDPENPTVGATSGYPAGWVKNGASFTINGPVSDPGLGVKKGKLYLKESSTLKSELGCDGHYSNPCPANHTFQFSVGSASFDEGEKSVEFSAEDALGKPSSAYKWMMKVDRTPPEVDLAGQLAIATGETEGDGKDEKDQALTLPVYNLQINAKDGKSPAEGTIAPADKRSGVKSIEVFLDQKATAEAKWEASSCPSGNCPLSKTFALKLNELGALTEHTLRVVVRDFAGNAPRERNIEFEYIPATGMKDEYVMQYFPLPDGTGNEAEEEHPRRPELAVNLVSGNLVYRQKDVEVETASADLEVELFYNSLLPESQNTEWGDGWTMGEEPSLEVEDPEAGPPTEATIVEESGAIENKIDLPAATGEESFDKRIQATVTKEPGGGYEITDESGETGDSLVFSPSGRLDEVENGTAATVEYDYEEGDLAEIAIEDPGTADVDPESFEPDDSPPGVAVFHSANFATSGSQPGQLEAPADVVLDEDGNLFVLDGGNHRIQKFSPGGDLISQFGGQGSADGQLNNPTAIALDESGNIWVADAGNTRIQKFSPQGQFLAKWGSFGWGAGKVFVPNGIAVGADGSIWLSEPFRVQRFTPEGQYIEQVGTEELASPEGIDIDAGGNAFVVDKEKDQVLVFDQEGDHLRSFGSAGPGPGQFQSPAEVDVDSAGHVWVADAEADHIQLFTAAGDHIASFGSQGSGAQQLQLTNGTGIASDGQGRVWVADAGNDRVARWLASSITGFFHSANFGTTGSQPGQLEAPADVALDEEGNLFVVDYENHRVQKFGPDGQLLFQFGGQGSADGQLNNPSAIALDADQNIWVADNGNSRIQKFSPQGQFLAKFGSFGWVAGKILAANGIAVGADGSIWVSENSRVQRFTPQGQYIEQVGNAEQLASPEGIDIDAGGNAFVVDREADKVLVFDQEGDHLRSFGSAGPGPGQFQSPAEVDVDSAGHVWVADAEADRIGLFTAAGDHIASFGSQGSGAQQFQLTHGTGIASDGQGRVWVADAGNDRVSDWIGGHYEASDEPVPTEDDPQFEVEVSEGLVESVEGEEVGAVSYEHDGDLLTSVEGPDSEADFTYDSAGRMTKVTLANGTYAEIAYEPTYGRVESVAVAPEGADKKTTFFNYSDEPRRTTVVPPDGPITTYDFAADGSVFKWWSSSQPPTFDYIAGTLADPNNRETSQPIPVGAHTLNMQAHSDEGIASIQIVADNNQLVDEKTCEFNPSEPTSCVTVKNEWVTETANWPPGIVHLEVIATDRLGNSSSERFWVNIPYTPPPDPEAEEDPRFSDILRFREEFGLDLDLKGDEFAINDRIFDLVGAWHNPMTPEGEVARASMERWGVPLRPADIAELEYRDSYIPHDGSAIRQWGEQQISGSYAGYYVDHRAGGIIYVALLGIEAERNALLSSVAGVLSAPGRVRPDPGSFVRTQNQLRVVQEQAVAEAVSHPELDGDLSGAYIAVRENQVVISMVNLGKAESILGPKFGPALKIVQGSAPVLPPAKFSRYNNKGPMQAGDFLRNASSCTAGFGAWDIRDGKSKGTGDKTYVPLQLTAGHCWKKGFNVWRGDPGELLGKVTRNNYKQDGSMTLDGATISTTWSEVGRSIYINKNREKAITGYATPVIGQWVCLSGERTNRWFGEDKSIKICGPVLDEPRQYIVDLPNGAAIRTIEVPVAARVSPGDSGGPAWIMGTGQAVGLITGAYDEEYGYGECTDLYGGEYAPSADNGEYICPVVGITTVQQIVTGASTLYNSEKLSKEGVPFPEPLYIGGVVVRK